MSKKERSLEDIKRSKPTRSSYERLLIVCEGSKTEPNYFQALIDDLKLNTANVEVDGKSGSSPVSVVKYAQTRFEKDRKDNGTDNCFDQVYCVIDKDEHPTYQEALELIRSGKFKDLFHAITSVPCFEYWLLLHFRFTTSPLVRKGERSPGDCTKAELKQHLPDYEKGDKETYKTVKDKTNTDIINAQKANLAATQTETDNPTTLVHTLVDFLRNLKK